MSNKKSPHSTYLNNPTPTSETKTLYITYPHFNTNPKKAEAIIRIKRFPNTPILTLKTYRPDEPYLYIFYLAFFPNQYIPIFHTYNLENIDVDFKVYKTFSGFISSLPLIEDLKNHILEAFGNPKLFTNESEINPPTPSTLEEPLKPERVKTEQLSKNNVESRFFPKSKKMFLYYLRHYYDIVRRKELKDFSESVTEMYVNFIKPKKDNFDRAETVFISKEGGRVNTFTSYDLKKCRYPTIKASFEELSKAHIESGLFKQFIEEVESKNVR